MAKTKVLTAPYDSDGSLLHYPGDGRKFSHHEDKHGLRMSQEMFHSLTWEERDLVGVRAIHTEPDWRPNEPFHASLQIDSMRSGRSAKYVILRPVNSPLDVRRYPMFVTDLLTVAIERGIHAGGIMHGRWMVAQRGENYGLRAAKEGE